MLAPIDPSCHTSAMDMKGFEDWMEPDSSAKAASRILLVALVIVVVTSLLMLTLFFWLPSIVGGRWVAAGIILFVMSRWIRWTFKED